MKTFKGFIKPDLSGTIPPLYKERMTYEETVDKANLLNADHFSSLTVFDERQSTLSHLPFSGIFNLSLVHSKVPTAWKQANILSIFKRNNPSEISNYRPISLLNMIGKAMEKCL